MNIRPSNLASISAPDDDFVSHCGSWREALTIARALARVDAPDIDDRTYWDREIRAYDEAFASYTPGAIPEDFRTHHASWREALVIAHDNARVQSPDVDDKGYWAHELRAYDRAFASIGLLPPPLPTAAAQHFASEKNLSPSKIADALEQCDWSTPSIGNQAILRAAVEALRSSLVAAPDFDAVRNKRMPEMTPAQREDAHELWLREQVGWMGEYHEKHYRLLLRRLDEARAPAVDKAPSAPSFEV